MAWRLETVKKNCDIFCSLAFKNPLNCPHRHPALTPDSRGRDSQRFLQADTNAISVGLRFSVPASQPRGILQQTIWIPIPATFLPACQSVEQDVVRFRIFRRPI